jgi:putative FmdB family regulatory protein
MKFEGEPVVPIYEYECGFCKEQHELIQKISDKPFRKCPSCGSLKLRRKVSLSAFHLKGEGWYATEYGNGEKKDKEDEKGNKTETADKTSESKAKKEESTAKTEKSDTKKKGKAAGASKAKTPD